MAYWQAVVTWFKGLNPELKRNAAMFIVGFILGAWLF